MGVELEARPFHGLGQEVVERSQDVATGGVMALGELCRLDDGRRVIGQRSCCLSHVFQGGDHRPGFYDCRIY